MITRGAIELPELGVTLSVRPCSANSRLTGGQNRRTASAVAVGRRRNYVSKYSDVRELEAQNPQFGFYLMRLMVQQMPKQIRAGAGARRKRLTNGPSQAVQFRLSCSRRWVNSTSAAPSESAACLAAMTPSASR